MRGSDDTQEAMQRFELWPHRSLGRAGIIALLCIIAASLTLVALSSPPRFIWPISFGCLLTFAAISVALASNIRSAQAREVVEIGPQVVQVHRVEADGRCRTTAFATYWVRIVVSHDRKVASHITLIQSGRRMSIGTFLSPAERETLASTLREALAEAKGRLAGAAMA
jgi:uncharacterized membrane protein